MRLGIVITPTRSTLTQTREKAAQYPIFTITNMAGSYGNDSVYKSRPYHALYMSDDEGDDDDLCVWDLEGEGEPLAGQFEKVGIESNTTKVNDNQREKVKSAEKPETPTPGTAAAKGQALTASDIDPKTGKLTEAAFREREVQYALSTARRNLTHASQFLLKLEARAGKTTKEGIRQTLDATVKDMNYDFNACGTDGAPPDADHKSEIEEIKQLSRELYNRLYLVDRHWRRVARETRDSEGRSPNISILSEGEVREWIKVEIKTNHLATEDACFYTAADLATGRSFRDWITYLQKACNFGDHPVEQAKLVEFAWRFLDRNLRGPRPVNPTSVEQFITDLDARRKSGIWDEIRKNLEKQEQDDAEAWRAMRKYWSSRTAPA
ncbi:hypothetical protein O1611_g5218 [Lasiodiplodia mahajangana]|uniref:Uncharacterized protein n=1 Tax=Lasiodiplodia mahajangana TaxID=1108764 RepID=A0ACC2JLU6_9PEZI|nr:hypothetical protein O1611_g5218 [Lasiodiplodia mahajangana]